MHIWAVHNLEMRAWRAGRFTKREQAEPFVIAQSLEVSHARRRGNGILRMISPWGTSVFGWIDWCCVSKEEVPLAVAIAEAPQVVALYKWPFDEPQPA